MKQLQDLKAEEVRLMNQRKQANQLDVNAQQAISNAILKNQRSQKQLNEQIATSIQNNQRLITTIQKETNTLGALENKIKSLKETRKQADAEAAKGITNQIQLLEAQRKKIVQQGSTGGLLAGLAGGSTANILQGLLFGTGFGIATRAVAELRAIAVESTKLALEAEGVEKAFGRLNQPNLLQNLRDATRGTVSDLELMKQAVVASNFQIPLEKFGTLLGFARQRARDTGQSVDYLVNSITEGIGKRSALILDNLGISILRVREEFKKTGDFTQAAINVINEELKKQGEILDTNADKVDRLNAIWNNIKVTVGDALINIADILTSSFGEGGAKLGLLIFGQEQQVKTQLEGYLDSYKRADEKGRRAIEAQVKTSYDHLLAIQETAQNAGLQSLADNLQKQVDLYRKSFAGIGAFGTPLTIAEQNVQQLQQRKSLNEEIINSYTKFQLQDNKNLAERNRLLKENEEIQKTIDFITGKKDSKKTSYKDQLQEAKANDGILKLLLNLERLNNEKFKALYEADQAAGIEQSQENREAREKSYAAEQKRLNNQIEQRTIEIELTFERNKNRIDELKTKLSQLEKEQSQAQDIIERITAPPKSQKTAKQITLSDRAYRSNLSFAVFGARQEGETDEEFRQREIRMSIEAYQSLAEAAVNAYNTIAEAQIRALDTEIQVRQSRIDAATKLAERGNAEALKIEQKRLEETIKQREVFARRQQLINSALAVSDAIVAVASAASQSGAGAIVIVPAVIAAIVAGYAAVAAATSESVSASNFAEGVVGLQGKGTTTSDSIPANLSKGESVITAAATAKNRDLLELANKGYDLHTLMQPKYVEQQASKRELAETNELLQGVIDTVSGLKFRAENRLDGAGVHQLIETQARIDRNKFR